MRWVLIVLLAVGGCFIGLLLFWPQTPATSQLGDTLPKAPKWLARLAPNPPAALPSANSLPPSELSSGGSWTGSFTANNRELGVVRIHLISGAALKITAQEQGEEDQTLCILDPSTPRPSGCSDKNISDGPKGGIVVRKGAASIRIESPSGRTTFKVNE